jgi:DNA-binding response OmpR family regulator
VQFDNRPTPIQLTRVENRLMAYLIENVGVVCSQEDILTNVWGPGRNKAVVEKTINRLRSKIEQDPSRPQYIISVWGQGYILENAAKLP